MGNYCCTCRTDIGAHTTRNAHHQPACAVCGSASLIPSLPPGPFVEYDPPDIIGLPPRACRDHTARQRWPNRSHWLPLIGETHNWLCYVCDDLIDQRLPPTDRRGATLLLVVPVSEGGSRTSPLNMRVAHRGCNNVRARASAGRSGGRTWP